MKKLTVLLLLIVLFGVLCTAAEAENFNEYFGATFNKSPKFYTGPGSNYLRAGNGKAQYGGGGQARVYGYEGNWLLMGYETGSGNYRIGYIEKKYTSNMTVKSGYYNLRKMNFEYRSCSITSGCDITDDPVIKHASFGWLSSGTSCTYLANYGGSWAYIEVYVNGQKARGFVPSGNVSYSGSSYSGSSYSGSSYSGPSYSGYSSYSSGTKAGLLMRLSTRSGPGTNYDEPGTFFQNSWQWQTVTVLGKSWDSRNDIWWVLVDFSENGTRYRAWTGLKRVNVNINYIPQIYSIGEGTISATDTWRGPGGNYAKGPRVNSWKDVVAYGRENGYVEVEYYYNGRIYRCWVPESRAQISYH